jgi:hypothetical protein
MVFCVVMELEKTYVENAAFRLGVIRAAESKND